MKKYKNFVTEAGRCWPGHKPVPGKKPFTPGSCVKEEVLEEGRPSQRHPLEGHDYHKKTDAELTYIAKDAHKAAEAMKSHNTAAENKYRDQANDSATVRYRRQKHGMPDWYKKKYGHIKEEVELDEVSMGTLKSYRKKSSMTEGSVDPKYPHGEVKHRIVYRRSGEKVEGSKSFSSKADAQKYVANKPEYSVQAYRVKQGVKDKTYMEEVEQVDELKQSTLGSYIKKASHDVATKSALTRHFATKSRDEKEKQNYTQARKDDETSNKLFNKSWKRRQGIAKAVDRLTKKEVEIS